MVNIAIDGPAGAGKSTIAREIAGRLQYIYIDTGAMYRALALACIRKSVDAMDEAAVSGICREVSVTIKYIGGEQRVFLNQEDVSSFIRSEQVSRMTSAISVYKEVRGKLLSLQRELAAKENVIMDGRDIGTTVLPDADVKIYLTASPAIRAKRRFEQLEDKSKLVSLEEIEREISERDYRDMHREIAPLRQAEDALLVDTSGYSVNEVVNKIVEIIEDKVGARDNGSESC